MDEHNKLVLIGNGFDLAHGLKTSYKDFLDWYICKAFQKFREAKYYSDSLIVIENKYTGMTTKFKDTPKTFEEVFNCISSEYESFKYQGSFFRNLVESFNLKKWVDVERYYFGQLKTRFSSPNLQDKETSVSVLNRDFNFLIGRLSDYIQTINNSLPGITELKIDKSVCNFYRPFQKADNGSKTKYLNFNYTDTLHTKGYANQEQIIHIHGQVSDGTYNPIIFGYGDETDPVYQNIEDSGENVYLEHIKSFGYFTTGKYEELLSYIDSAPYVVYIVGHSCGLSDRVLLNEIFEHPNCIKIDIFYHVRNDGTDNFKEITQEISRHFRPQNKNLMRRKVISKNGGNFIPQNDIA